MKQTETCTSDTDSILLETLSMCSNCGASNKKTTNHIFFNESRTVEKLSHAASLLTYGQLGTVRTYFRIVVLSCLPGLTTEFFPLLPIVNITSRINKKFFALLQRFILMENHNIPIIK